MTFSVAQWVSLATIALIVAIGQILFKMTSETLNGSEPYIVSLLKSPVFWIAIALYGSATIAWIVVIKNVPISRAYMFMALTYVFVPGLSAAFLGEEISATNAVASLLIICGIAVTAYSS